MDGEIVDHLNAVNDDCAAAIHDGASLTAAMWPCATPLPELAPRCYQSTPVRPIATVSAVPSLPSFLATENIPLDQMQALTGGFFSDGVSTSHSSLMRVEKKQEDCEIKINVLEERHGHENQRNQSSQNDPGDKLILKPEGDQRQSHYEGRVWRSFTDDC